MKQISGDKAGLNFFHRFLLYFLSLMLLSFLVSFSILTFSRNQRLHEHKIQSEAQIQYLGDMIESHFESVKSDLLFLPELNELIRYKNIKNELDRNSIELEFLNFSKTKKVYDQIRYIGSSGQEEIRVNYNSGDPNIVDKEDLQNKLDRYYFYESFSLENGNIYVSALDLNKERGQIEQPLKPMIRFGTPIINSEGEKSGVIVLNYLASEFIEELEAATSSSPGVYALLNEDGYWLYKNNPEEEWGFMYSDRSDMTLATKNPELWDELSLKSFGHILKNDNIYTFLELLPLGYSAGVQNSPRWYLVNKINSDDLGLSWTGLIRKFLIYNLFAAFVFGFLTFFLAKAVDQRNEFKNALKHSALYDSLTDLPNRELLKSSIYHLIEELKRYNQIFAVMFIDLDGFKAVNDTLGHDSGDELLIQVAERLKNAVRSSDTVSRIGGDEFVILINHLENRDQCTLVAHKVLKAMNEEFTLTVGPANIGASIGIALTEIDTDPDMESLMKRADKAMYRVKNSGKGNFEID